MEQRFSLAGEIWLFCLSVSVVSLALKSEIEMK